MLLGCNPSLRQVATKCPWDFVTGSHTRQAKKLLIEKLRNKKWVYIKSNCETFPDYTTCEERCQLHDAVLLMYAVKSPTSCTCITWRLLWWQSESSLFIRSEMDITDSASVLDFQKMPYNTAHKIQKITFGLIPSLMNWDGHWTDEWPLMKCCSDHQLHQKKKSRSFISFNQDYFAK